MSEFFFDYKCIAMGDQNMGKPYNKALDFYLFQDYDGEGSTMCAQVYVPKSMQEKYVGAKVYFSLNDIEFPDISNTKIKPEVWHCKKSAKGFAEARYISRDNSIFIKGVEGELSGCGVIAFLENEFEEPKISNCYKFTINYAKKETISYKIIESRGLLKIHVIYPLIKNNIELCLIQKQGSKPVLVGDNNNYVNRMDSVDEKIVIELKANGRVEDSYKGLFRVANANRHDYRLTFLNESDGSYYLLVDESDFTMEDKAQRREERKESNKTSLSNPRCPYCGKPMLPHPKYKEGTTMIVDCQGNVLSKNSDDAKLRGKLTVVCELKLKESETNTNPIDNGHIGVDHLIIPKGYAERPSMNVVVAGFPKSGKTIYLSSLFNMQDGGDDHGIRSNPFILNKILTAFDKKGKGYKAVEEVKFYNLEGGGGNYKFSEDCERIRSSTRYDIKKRYVMSVGGNVESQTNMSSADKLSWHPIGYQFGNLGHAFFYDIPGEMFRNSNTTHVRALNMADCLLAVIDGSSERIVDDLLTTLQRIPHISEGNIDMRSMPIAIVFTKHDLKLSEYAKKEGNMEFCFDSNCHVIKENVIELFPKNGKYEGSALERHIDCSSYELEHYLRARGNSEQMATLKANYKNIKFFTCSALGTDDCLGRTINETKEVLFRPRRLRVELPIIWLMYKKGLIKG